MAILRIGGFLILYLNAAAVFLGVMAQAIARGWLAFELTGSNAASGGILLAFGVALLLATPWGGVAADRLPKRLVLQLSVLLLAVSSAWIGLAVVFDVIAYWMLLGASVLQAVGFALFGPARMAFLAELVPRGSVPPAVSLLLFTPPDRNRYKLAALKHAYLAACLDLRAIPETPCADLIRHDLRAARDATSRAGVPVSEYALSMPLMRTHEQPSGPSIALGIVRRPDGLADIWIALAGTMAVPWPLPDRRPVI
ncbi:MFS transporter [Blastococcus sp. SYSU DS0552]